LDQQPSDTWVDSESHVLQEWLPVLTSALLDIAADVAAFALFRLALVISTLLHEWCHLVVASILTSRRQRDAAGEPVESAIWSAANMRGNVSRRDWLASLCPVMPLRRSFAPHVVIPGVAGAPSASWARGGPLAGTSAAFTPNDHLSSGGEARRGEFVACDHELPAQASSSSSSSSSWGPSPMACAIDAAIIRHAGWIFSLLLSALVWIALFLRSSTPDGGSSAPSSGAWLVDVALGASVCAASALASDALRLSALPHPADAHTACCDVACPHDGERASPRSGGGGSEAAAWRFFCGNFGMIMAQSREALHAWGRGRAVDALGVLERMAGISSERGGQSGGVVTFERTWRGDMVGVRVRAKPAKRQSLSHQLISKFRVALFLNRLTDSLSFLLALLLWPLTLLLQAFRLYPAPTAAVASSPGSGRAAAAAPGGGGTTAPAEGGQEAVRVYLGHTRFATSSVPSVGETHPHQWVAERRVPLWRVHGATGAVRCEPTNVGMYVTHNGDFEFWNLFGRDRTHSEVGPWLEVVLEVHQPAQCDSVMIAGLMDLLRTHALWLPSLRLAFHQTVVMSYEEVLSPQSSHALPCLADLAPVAAAAERAMAHVVATMAAAGGAAPTGPAQPAPRAGGTALRVALAGKESFLEDAILAALHGRPLPCAPHAPTPQPAATAVSDSVAVVVGQGEEPHAEEPALLLQQGGDAQGREQQGEGQLPECLVGLSPQLLLVLVRQAVANFLDNDLFWAAKKFLENAKGSFGMTVACTADCDRVVLAARNQPLALGLAPHERAVLFSSESHSLLTPLSPAPHTQPATAAARGSGTAGAGGGRRRIAYRVDLDEAEGEVMEVVMRGHAHGRAGGQGGSPVAHAEGRGAAANGVEVRGEVGGSGAGEGNGHVERAAGAGAEGQEEGCLDVPEVAFVALKLHSIKHGQPVTTAQFRQRNRLIPVVGNPFLCADADDSPDDPPAAWGPAACCSASAPPCDLVEADLRAVPRVLELIRADWQDGRSLNRRTAAALAAMLQGKAEAAAAAERAMGEAVGGMSRKEIDVLVTGVETSLWVGEQFAADLQNCFPQLRVVAVSANKVIGVMGNARGAISTAGFALSRLGAALPARHAIVIALSQSGQTFPTLHATRILSKHCPGRVFVCTGMLDCKMATAVGLSLAKGAAAAAGGGSGGGDGWCCRVFHTHAGWRSAEPASLSAVACHATLTELLLHAARTLRANADAAKAAADVGAKTVPGVTVAQGAVGGKSNDGAGVLGWVQRPLGLRLSGGDVGDLERMRDAVAMKSAPDIVGWTARGHRVHTHVNSALRSQGLMWALHVLETPIAWAISSVYIFIAVVLGVPIFSSIIKALPIPNPTAADALLYVARAFDALLFCFLPLLVALPLRVLTGRDLLARLGKRTVVVADVPWVHQALEVYVSKLFALSFWVAAVDVHGASPIDHLVHRFTHRVSRGTLLAFGRPDGRLCSQSRCESWVLMALLQARTIVSLGCGAEAITVGHNPYHARSLVKRHVVLPSNRPKFLCEKLLGVDDLEPMKRMATREHIVSTAAGKSPFEALDSQVVGLHLCNEGTVQRARQMGLSMLAHGMSDISTADAEDPANRESILSALGGDVRQLLHSQAPIEDICENRFLSLERLIAFHVLFHRMAAVVASLPPLRFNIAQSQSRLRIATTAAPVSAADLEREWMDSVADATVHDLTLHRRTRHHHHIPLLPHPPHHHHHHHHNHSHHGGMSIPSPFFSSHAHHQHSQHGYTHRISETLQHLLPLHLPTSHTAHSSTTPSQRHAPSASRHGHTEHVGGSYHGGGTAGGGGSQHGSSHHGASHHGGFLRSILPLKSPRSSHGAMDAPGSGPTAFGRSSSSSGSSRHGAQGSVAVMVSQPAGAKEGDSSAAADRGGREGPKEAFGAEGLGDGAAGRAARVSFDVHVEQSAEQGRMRRLSVDVTPGSSLRGGMAGGVTLGPWSSGGVGATGMVLGVAPGSVLPSARGRAVGADALSGDADAAARMLVPPTSLAKVEEAGGQSPPAEKGGAGTGKGTAGEGGEEDGSWRTRGGERKVKGGGEILRLLKEK
ncbi:hypothetical protein CLOM_g6423, partial [Closterium sp. NIES-68]